MGFERPDLIRRYWKGVFWSPSYFAASRGGAPINILKTYIEQRKTPPVTWLPSRLNPRPELRGFTFPRIILRSLLDRSFTIQSLNVLVPTGP